MRILLRNCQYTRVKEKINDEKGWKSKVSERWTLGTMKESYILVKAT